MARTRMGYRDEETKMLTLGQWSDQYEAYKRTFNMERGREHYRVGERKVASLLTL